MNRTSLERHTHLLLLLMCLNIYASQYVRMLEHGFICGRHPIIPSKMEDVGYRNVEMVAVL